MPPVLDSLRQPLETGETVIARASHRICYPSRIQLVAAMNPCRCGGSGPGQTCKRGARCAADYQARVSGPLLDRIDLTIEVPAVSAADLCLPPALEGSNEVRNRVTSARQQQTQRWQDHDEKIGRTNADLSGQALDEIASPDPAGLALLHQAADKFMLSARGIHRTHKVARPLADREGEDQIDRYHIAEALSYRREILTATAPNAA